MKGRVIHETIVVPCAVTSQGRPFDLTRQGWESAHKRLPAPPGDWGSAPLGHECHFNPSDPFGKRLR